MRVMHKESKGSQTTCMSVDLLLLALSSGLSALSVSRLTGLATQRCDFPSSAPGWKRFNTNMATTIAAPSSTSKTEAVCG